MSRYHKVTDTFQKRCLKDQLTVDDLVYIDASYQMGLTKDDVWVFLGDLTEPKNC